jgi:hypothetical protein
MNKPFKVLAATAGAAAIVLSGTAAASARGGAPTTCSGGEITSGTYTGLIITGECSVASGATVTVNGNVTVQAGAAFDASTDSQITINGNVYAGPGSFFALGCTQAHPCSDTGVGPAGGFQTHDVVTGNVTLDNVFDAAINGDTIYGNLTSSGGGPGLLDPETDFIPFSIKDDVIGGNLTVTNLTGVWFGVIRTEVGKNVTLQNIAMSDPDGNEIVTDQIAGNLNCSGLNPAPQVGDSGGDPNLVGKHANGQCAGLTG